MVGARLCLTVSLGRRVAGVGGKTEWESLSMRVQGFVPNNSSD